MANRRSAEHQRRVLETRRSSAASPHRDRSKYDRKGYDVADDFPTCVMCDTPNVSYLYPGPMCASCHREWAE